MSFRLFHWPVLALVAGALAAALPVKTPAAEILEAKDGLSLTNAPRRTHRSLQQLEDELTKSFQSFSPKSSLDGLMAPAQPVPRPATPARRTKEEDRQNSWKVDLKDLTRDLSDDDMTKLLGNSTPQEKRGRGKTSLEDLYSFPDGKSSSSWFGDNSRNSGGKQADKLTDSSDDRMPGGIRDSERALRRAMESEASGGSTFGGGFLGGATSDPFGLNGRSPSAADLEAHRNYMQEYRNLLNMPSPSASSWSATQFGDTRQPQAQTLNPLSPGISTPATRGPEITPGNVNAFLNPQRVQDVNATVLNQWNPMYTPPRVETPKRIEPTTPVTQYQRRKF